MPAKTVSDLLSGRTPHVIGPTASLREAADLLQAHDIGALPVIEEGRLIGILSERDILRRGICADRPLPETPVAEIMTPSPQTTRPDCSVAEALMQMTAGGFRHLPVVEGERLVGIISVRDIPALTRVLSEQFEDFRRSVPGMRMAGRPA